MIVLRYRYRATTVADPAFVTYERLGKAFKYERRERVS